MSKRAKELADFFVGHTFETGEDSAITLARLGYINGYEKAKEDIIAHIRNTVKFWMPDNPERDEYIEGKRLAFRSVLVLLDEMERK